MLPVVLTPPALVTTFKLVLKSAGRAKGGDPIPVARSWKSLFPTPPNEPVKTATLATLFTTVVIGPSHHVSMDSESPIAILALAELTVTVRADAAATTSANACLFMT